jgi:hypothetical protein
VSIERLSSKWSSPVYAFYQPVPAIEIIEGRRSHLFACAGNGCKYTCRRYLDKGDSNSTGNLRKHVRTCWGEEALQAAENMENVNHAREKVVNVLKQSGSIPVIFERNGKGKVTYLTRQHTRTETRMELIRWVAESLRPFAIVKDRGFQSLMKTGWPHYYLPSPMTVSRDVKTVFARTHGRIAKLLKVRYND